MPSFQPYWGKPAVRKDRGDRGDVGIIRSPVRASILPDCLFHKRLEKGRFVWPPVQDGAIRLSAAQLSLLLEGLDWSRVRPKPVIAPLLAG